MGFKEEPRGDSRILELAWPGAPIQKLYIKLCNAVIALYELSSGWESYWCLSTPKSKVWKKGMVSWKHWADWVVLHIYSSYSVAILLRWIKKINSSWTNSFTRGTGKNFILQTRHREVILQEESSKCTKSFVFNESMRSLPIAPDEAAHSLPLTWSITFSFLSWFPTFSFTSFFPPFIHPFPAPSPVPTLLYVFTAPHPTQPFLLPPHSTLRLCGPTPSLWVAASHRSGDYRAG